MHLYLFVEGEWRDRRPYCNILHLQVSANVHITVLHWAYLVCFDIWESEDERSDVHRRTFCLLPRLPVSLVPCRVQMSPVYDV